MLKGIDISNLNGNVNMELVKNAGYEFVFCRATEGTSGSGSRDPYYKQNIENAKKVGLLTGAYHFSHFADKTKELSEVGNFLDFIKDTNPDIVILDAENSCTGDITDLCIDFLDKVSAVAQPLFYANPSWIQAHLNSSITKYPLWIANYGVSKPRFTLWPYFTVWQYADKGQVSGISGYLDLNYMDDNFFKVIKDKTVSAVQKYDTNTPAESETVKHFLGDFYFEKRDDGGLGVHVDRGNYITIYKGKPPEAYWDDNNGHSGSKQL